MSVLSCFITAGQLIFPHLHASRRILSTETKGVKETAVFPGSLICPGREQQDPPLARVRACALDLSIQYVNFMHWFGAENEQMFAFFSKTA